MKKVEVKDLEMDKELDGKAMSDVAGGCYPGPGYVPGYIPGYPCYPGFPFFLGYPYLPCFPYPIYPVVPYGVPGGAFPATGGGPA
ncbi:MAG: hypothetical protein SWQ30_07590 [Thermodesulfobacteriota bacterium]|nr:hypothetical protein [Thermodesulfobacteriota bacterium]